MQEIGCVNDTEGKTVGDRAAGRSVPMGNHHRGWRSRKPGHPEKLQLGIVPVRGEKRVSLAAFPILLLLHLVKKFMGILSRQGVRRDHQPRGAGQEWNPTLLSGPWAHHSPSGLGPPLIWILLIGFPALQLIHVKGDRPKAQSLH